MRPHGRVIILSGPSGAGKTTLHDLLLKDPFWAGRIIRSVSATTRLPRGQEQQGREYFFMSPAMFAHKIRAGHFLEWMKVFDHYYGTPMKNVREALRRGKHVLLCIDVKGARQVKKVLPEALMIFVRTPTQKELRRRLEARGTDTRASVALRLKTAAQELKDAGRYDHVIVNDTLQDAFARLKERLAAALGESRLR